MAAQVHLIVVRHSERLDEADENAWRKHLSNSTRKNAKDDPIISPGKGAQYARQMASTVKNLLEKDLITLPPVLYTSRLLRAVQTAAFVANELNIPIHLSSGLAQIIPAVKKAGGSFEFTSMEDLRSLCPGVELVDCDREDSPHFVPTSHWKDATSSIVSAHPRALPIIVAHRETIRKLAGEFKQTPCCCVGLFTVEGRTDAAHENPADGILGENDAKESDSEPLASEHDESEKQAPVAGEKSSGRTVSVAEYVQDKPHLKCGNVDPPTSKATLPPARHDHNGRVGGAAATTSVPAGEIRQIRRCGTLDPGPGAALVGLGRGGRGGAGRGMQGGRGTVLHAQKAATKASSDALEVLAHIRLVQILDRDGSIVPQK